jgi:hypothetical protein
MRFDVLLDVFWMFFLSLYSAVLFHLDFTRW